MNKLVFILIFISIFFLVILLSIIQTNKTTLYKEKFDNNPIFFILKVEYFTSKTIISKDKKNFELYKAIAISFSKNLDKNITQTLEKLSFNSNDKQKKEILEFIYEHLNKIASQAYFSYLNKLRSSQYNNKKLLNILTIIEALICIFIIVLFTFIFIYYKTIELKKEIYTDNLTNLYNRKFFHKIKNKLPQKNVIALMDIDHFKKINDTYGHDIGDFVLKEISNLIKKHIRENDIVIRWGGEEILIILKNVNLDFGKKILSKLKNKIANYDFKGIKITASFGVTEIGEKITIDDIKKIDKALYISKKEGRNKITYI